MFTDPDIPKLLDHENLWDFSIGCIDCEMLFGNAAPRCPAHWQG